MEKSNSHLEDFFNQEAARGEEGDKVEGLDFNEPTGRRTEIVRSSGGSIKKVTTKQKLQSGVKRATNVMKLSEDGYKPQKFEIKLQLKKIEVKLDKTSIFRIQMRCVDVFKMACKKKYKIESPA
jgi:hypothetical protein